MIYFHRGNPYLIFSIVGVREIVPVIWYNDNRKNKLKYNFFFISTKNVETQILYNKIVSNN